MRRMLPSIAFGLVRPIVKPLGPSSDEPGTGCKTLCAVELGFDPRQKRPLVVVDHLTGSNH
jgi:hypothetical protein